MHQSGCGGSPKVEGQVPGAMAASLVVNDSDDFFLFCLPFPCK